MSGGLWDYRDGILAGDIFGHGVVDYGDNGRKKSLAARKKNPLEDKEFSEMVFDMFCVLHSFDWYQCGDTDEEQYRDDLSEFKEKWLGKTQTERTKTEIDKSVAELKSELYKTLGCDDCR